MKKLSGRQLLLILSSLPSEYPGASLEVLELCLDIHPSTLRSTAHLFKTEKILWQERHGDVARVGLTPAGVQAATNHFPCISSTWEGWKTGEWSLIIFKRPSLSDPQFRQLSKLLVMHRAFRVTRGVFAVAGELPNELAVTMGSLYSDVNVLVCTVKEWQRGFSRADIVRQYDLETLSVVYSGISKEIDKLLIQLGNKIVTIQQSKVTIRSIIARLHDAFLQDPGFTQAYFPFISPPRVLHSHLGTVVGAIEKQLLE